MSDTVPVDGWHKHGEPGGLRREAAGLRWLAAAGGARVAQVIALDRDRLELERIRAARPTQDAAAAFGRALARTHAAGAPGWGAPPPGESGDGTLGAASLPTPAAPPTGWGPFYAEYRLLPYLRSAVDRQAIDQSAAGLVERCAARLATGDLDHDQPRQVASLDMPVARLHGDLWSGNVLWTSDGQGVEAVLIDPAAHGGHAETDLAMLALFGLPHLESVIAGYDESSALAPGWTDRVALHQLHPLLVHAALFGGGYGRQAVAAAACYA